MLELLLSCCSVLHSYVFFGFDLLDLRLELLERVLLLLSAKLDSLKSLEEILPSSFELELLNFTGALTSFRIESSSVISRMLGLFNDTVNVLLIFVKCQVMSNNISSFPYTRQLMKDLR